MRLLTHNMLQCPRTKEYPLRLEVRRAEVVDVEYSEAFIRRMLSRIDWSVFRAAAAPFTQVDLPVSPPDENVSEQVLKDVHKALLEWHVIDGVLISPSGASYDITDGIPNLIIVDVKGKKDENHQHEDNVEHTGERHSEDDDHETDDQEDENMDD